MQIPRESKDLIIRAMVAHVYTDMNHLDKAKVFGDMKKETDPVLVTRIIRELTTRVRVDQKIFLLLPRVLQPKDILRIKEVRANLTSDKPTNVITVNFLYQNAKKFVEPKQVERRVKKKYSISKSNTGITSCRTSRISQHSWRNTKGVHQR